MKLGIIIDSASGLTEKEAKIRGWKFLPLYLSIDGKEYADGIDITAKKYYSMIDISMNVKTSATPPAIITKTLSDASKEFDHVIVYPLSTNLSSQTNSITTFAKEFKNVHVIQSKGVGSAIVTDLEKLEAMAKNGSTIKEIVDKGNELTNALYGIVAIESMDWLVKGGRASASAAAMANMLKIVPLIAFKDGKLEKHGKGRVFKKAITKAAKNVIKELGDDFEFTIYNAGNKEIDLITKTIEKNVDMKLKVTNFPPIIGNHTGPGVVAIIGNKKN